MLEQVHNALWIADDENVSFYGAPYPTRSVIVRLENGDLWIWSPVELTAGLRAEIDHLGPGSPSREPQQTPPLYLHEWKTTYPDAALWRLQSTIKKRLDLPSKNR